MWHMTGDIRHVTSDTWHVTGGGRWTFSQNVRSLAIAVWDRRFDEDIFTNHDRLHKINELINDEDVYRTAPATPIL